MVCDPWASMFMRKLDSNKQQVVALTLLELSTIVATKAPESPVSTRQK